MAESDWTVLDDSVDIAAIARGVTTAITPPAGGGSFIYAFNSLVQDDGASGLYVNLTNFAPMAKGGSIRGALQRGPGGGAIDFSPMLFLCAAGNSVLDSAYKLGLSDEDPHRILLRKGSIATGMGGVAESAGLLMQGTVQYSQGTWVHLRLDVIVNLSGDVLLQAFVNDLSTNPIGGSFDWDPVPGMESGFVDDSLGIASGSPPYTSGYAGFAFESGEITRRGYVDHIEILRQT